MGTAKKNRSAQRRAEQTPSTISPDTSNDECFVETVDDMILLRRKLVSGRIINIDTCDGELLAGGYGIAHIDMNNGNNRIDNLKRVTEFEARRMLMEFEE